MKKLVLSLCAASALALAACGDDDSSEEAEEASATPQQAIAEISQVEAGLADALKSYESGDADAAAETVNETYLQHFELVEGPLEEADEDLNEELEEQIREELVDEIESGASKAGVAKLVADIEKGLAEAEAALSRGEGAAG